MSDESKTASAASASFEDDEGRIFKGSAVRNGRLIYTSVTQIKTFDKEHEGCPRKWTYHYVLKKKLAKTGALVKGADLGVLLYKYLTTGQDVLPPTLLPLNPQSTANASLSFGASDGAAPAAGETKWAAGLGIEVAPDQVRDRRPRDVRAQPRRERREQLRDDDEQRQ